MTDVGRDATTGKFTKGRKTGKKAGRENLAEGKDCTIVVAGYTTTRKGKTVTIRPHARRKPGCNESKPKLTPKKSSKKHDISHIVNK